MKISASGLKLARCMRRYVALKVVGGYAPEFVEAFRFGTKYHSIAEGFLKDGTLDNSCVEGRLFQESIPYLPKPGTVDVERHIEIEYEGITFHGYMDFSRPKGYSHPIALVGDHKTAAEAKWALNVNTLVDDEQGILYPWMMFEEGDAKDQCELHWQYGLKKTERAMAPVKVIVNWQDTEKRFLESLWPRALEMQMYEETFGEALRAEAARGSRKLLNTIPCNPKQCEFTGRFCDFANHCDIGNIMEDYSKVKNAEGKLFNEWPMKDRIEYKRLKQLERAGQTAVVPPEAPAALKDSLEGKSDGKPPETAPGTGNDTPADDTPPPAAKRAGRPPGSKNTPKVPPNNPDLVEVPVSAAPPDKDLASGLVAMLQSLQANCLALGFKAHLTFDMG